MCVIKNLMFCFLCDNELLNMNISLKQGIKLVFIKNVFKSQLKGIYEVIFIKKIHQDGRLFISNIFLTGFFFFSRLKEGNLVFPIKMICHIGKIVYLRIIFYKKSKLLKLNT